MNRQVRLQKLVDERFGGNQASFAKAIARASAQVNHWLTGHRKLGDAGARHIEMTLDLGQGYFDGKVKPGETKHLKSENPYPTGAESSATSVEESAVTYGPKDRTLVPVIRWEHLIDHGQARKLLANAENSARVFVQDDRIGSGAFALIVENESMRSRLDPSFEPGDFLVCDPSATVAAGDFVIAKELGVDAPTFKKLVFDSGRWFLASLNEAFPPMREIDDPKLRVIARVMQRVKITTF